MKYGNDPTFHSASVENIYEILREHDALLVIGDQAILTEKTDFDHYDLATEWHSLTRLPFVFAFWATNRRLTEQETKWLSDAYEQAEQNWEQIYGTAREVLCVDPLFLKRYYNVDLHYRLSRSDYEGLIRFFSLARDLRLIEKMRKDIWV